jgi:uncharacterized phiE125 gp8 family phage protein
VSYGYATIGGDSQTYGTVWPQPFGLTVVTAARWAAVELAEVKKHVRATGFDDDDEELNALALEATAFVESESRRTISRKQWRLTLDGFPYGPLSLPRAAPLVSVDSVTYVDSTGAAQAVAASDYRVVTAHEPGYVEPAYAKTWPSAVQFVSGAVEITYTAGYASVGFVPELIRRAVLLKVQSWYDPPDNPQLAKALDDRITDLIRKFWVGTYP